MSLTPVEIDRLADALVEKMSSRLAGLEVDPDALLDVHGAAELLSCSVPTVERLTRDGLLPSVKLGRLRRYSRAALLKQSRKHGGGDHEQSQSPERV